jgi:hypothetical protein
MKLKQMMLGYLDKHRTNLHCIQCDTVINCDKVEYYHGSKNA